jgi:LysM repeat protein
LPPTLTPTATATRPRPTATPVRYRVRFGDTLVSIAERYHISVQALMAANGLRNDLIRVGQELIIPIATPQP